MFARNPGRLVLTFILLFFGFGGIAIDANATHLFNPAWPPHARYHLVMQFVAFAALGAIGLWCLWRPGHDGLLHLRIAVIIPVLLIGSFYIAALVPTTSALHAPDMPVLHVLGVAVAPNIMAGTGALVCLPWAYRSARHALDTHVNNVVQTSHRESNTPMQWQEDAV